ncbi:MAG: hypothetical protein FWC73_10690 [Defluviitaleaceae bacterium]|nr:hypothetical protein [Defluviitaleaceae bacterium]
MFSHKPDYEAAQKRIDAFWNHEDTDRPLVQLAFYKEGATPYKSKHHPTYKDYWLDIEYRADQANHWMENTVYYAEAMPVFMPNLGPEIVSAWAGCPYHYGEITTWTEPCIFDWEKDNAVIDMEHPLFKATDKFTRLLLEHAKGKFIVGLTDFHPGGDHLAALRDPQVLAMDMLEYPDEVKAKLASSYKEYFPAFDYFVDLLKSAGMPISSWIPLTDPDGMYIPSNDFSCMISKDMFDEFFLEGLKQECKHYGRNIYHLDGPDAIRHLDSLLSIPELNAIQWVAGAGREECDRWLHVYNKVLSAGKSLLVKANNKEDLQFLIDHLPAKGLGIDYAHVKNEAEARDIMAMVEKGWA